MGPEQALRHTLFRDSNMNADDIDEEERRGSCSLAKIWWQKSRAEWDSLCCISWWATYPGAEAGLEQHNPSCFGHFSFPKSDVL